MFQDRAINLRQAISARYRDEPAVAGYNMLNEPAHESRAVVGPFYEPYLKRFAGFIGKKDRLAADKWGGDGEGPVEVTGPGQECVQEFPNFVPYPWGRTDWVRTLLLNIRFAQPLAYEYADLLKGLDDSELGALTESFALVNCDIGKPLLARLLEAL